MFNSPHENIIVNYSYSYCCCESGEDTLYSVFTDHLGSWKTVVNETDGQIYRQSFDAWGRKRNPQNWNSSVCSAFPFDRGYTGHQHLDEFGLINMNGRMYDVGLCRFLSPDPYVQAPDFTQNFNRYSYCLNNPLVYTDPSGEFIFTLGTLFAAPFTGGGSLAFLPYAIGADIGMWNGGTIANGTANPLNWDYSSGKTWSYMGAGLLIGAGTAGAGTLATNAIGTVAGGVAGGIVNGGGFGLLNGINSGLEGDELWNATRDGMFRGAATGLAGGVVSGAIGGGFGAFAGGAASNLTGQYFENGSFDEVNWLSAGLSGTSSFGAYHLSSYINWKSNVKDVDFNGHNINYRQYLRIQESYTRGRFWQSERAGGGFWLTEKGISREGVTYNPDKKNVVSFDHSQKPEGAWATFHPHPYFESRVYGHLYNSPVDLSNVRLSGVPSLIINKMGIELAWYHGQTQVLTRNLFWGNCKPYYNYNFIWR